MARCQCKSYVEKKLRFNTVQAKMQRLARSKLLLDPAQSEGDIVAWFPKVLGFAGMQYHRNCNCKRNQAQKQDWLHTGLFVEAE